MQQPSQPPSVTPVGLDPIPRRFYRWADSVQIPELSRLAGTVRAWELEILAFHTTGGCSNGPTEAVNLLIKKVKRARLS